MSLFRKDISVVQMWFASVGGIVGSGWLLGPFYAAQIAGANSILAWVLGGVLMLFIALAFAELATALPLAGGMARYAQLTHGTFASFLIAWVAYLAAAMVPPIETMAAMQYLGSLHPGLVLSVGGVVHLTSLGIGISAFIMFVLCAINCLTVKAFAKSNVWVVTWKLLIPIISIVVLFNMNYDMAGPAKSFHLSTAVDWQKMLHVLPAAGVIFSFIGFSPAIQLSAEAKNPQRAVPTAIIGSVLFAIVLYAIIEWSFVGAIPSAWLSHGWSNLSFTSDTGPVAGLMTLLGVGWFIKVIYFDAIVSPLGTSYIYTASTARVTYAMAENGYFPNFLKKINRSGSPWLAVSLNFVVGMIFFLPFPGWQELVGFIVSCFVFSYVIGPVAVYALRRGAPQLARPFRCIALPVISFVAFVICGLLLYWTGWPVISKMMITICVGLVYLLIFRVCKRGSNMPALQFKRSIWLIVYLFGIGIISYGGAFEGHRWFFSMGDYLAIVLLSILTWSLAWLGRDKVSIAGVPGSLQKDSSVSVE